MWCHNLAVWITCHLSRITLKSEYLHFKIAPLHKKQVPMSSAGSPMAATGGFPPFPHPLSCSDHLSPTTSCHQQAHLFSAGVLEALNLDSMLFPAITITRATKAYATMAHWTETTTTTTVVVYSFPSGGRIRFFSQFLAGAGALYSLDASLGSVSKDDDQANGFSSRVGWLLVCLLGELEDCIPPPPVSQGLRIITETRIFHLEDVIKIVGKLTPP